RLNANHKTPQDLAEAVFWFRKAADQGNLDAQYRLARCYSNGMGVGADPAKAAECYRIAAEKGHAVSQNALGDCYSQGIGVPFDQDEAIRWYRLAAAKGNPDAARSLRAAKNRAD
ncbi:MAG: sel1 repeat family protein, partial [Thermoguttaceae bacterium]|nr:sel1 repeat family protein [Thermoguttaceae bacterium]